MFFEKEIIRAEVVLETIIRSNFKINHNDKLNPRCRYIFSPDSYAVIKKIGKSTQNFV